jgi:hypothetical protein
MIQKIAFQEAACVKHLSLPKEKLYAPRASQQVQGVAHPELPLLSNLGLQVSKVNTFYKVEQLAVGLNWRCERKSGARIALNMPTVSPEKIAVEVLS